MPLSGREGADFACPGLGEQAEATRGAIWIRCDTPAYESVAEPAGQREELILLAIGLRPFPVAMESLGVGFDDHPQGRPGEVGFERSCPLGHSDRVVDKGPLEPGRTPKWEEEKFELGAGQRRFEIQQPLEFRHPGSPATILDELSEPTALEEAEGLGGDQCDLEVRFGE